ncbi:MAG: polysaccharide deacetylase family protein [Thermoleophilia bacterium]
MAVAVGVGGAFALLPGGDEPDGTPSAGAQHTTDSAAAVPAATAPPADRAEPPTAGEGAAAVAAVRRAGVPLYRTPGKAGKVVALTFDDGPGRYTEDTIATLRRYGMRATFFLNGTSIEAYPDLAALETEVAAVGNHSYAHVDLSALPAAAVRRQASRAQELIASETGEPVDLFRSPYGARTPVVDGVLDDLGMIQVLWSIDSGDSQGVGWEDMLRTITAQMRPGDIILLHENRGQTQMVVNRLVPWMARNGWTSVTVPEMLVMDPPSPAFLREQAGRRG